MASFVLVLSTFAAFGAWRTLKTSLDQAVQAKFEREVAKLQEEFEQQYVAYVGILDGAQGLFAASQTVEKSEWTAYVHSLNLLEKYPGLHDLGFAQRTADDRYVLRYIEPAPITGQSALGSLVFAQTALLRDVAFARDTGRAVVSRPTMSTSDGHAIVQIFHPVYRNDRRSETVNERRAALQGFVVGTLFPARIADTLIHHSRGIGLRIYDGEPRNENLIYRNFPTGEKSEGALARLTLAHGFDAGGHRWNMLFDALPFFDNQVDRMKQHLILACGGLLSVVMFALMWSMSTTRSQALSLAEDMTGKLRASQERFELAMEGANDGIWDWDLRSNEVFFSLRYKEMVGCTDTDMPNTYVSWESRVHPDDRDKVMEKLRAYLDRKQPSYEAEFRMLHKDGSYRWILARGAAVWSAGLPIRMVGFHTDISERKRADEEIREGRAFLEQVLDNVPVMTFLKDARHLRFVRVNKAMEELTGIPRETMIGKSDQDFFPKDQAEFFNTRDREVLAGRKLVDVPQEPIESKALGRRILHTRKIPVVNSAGLVTHLLGVSEDITDHLAVQEKLRAAKEVAETATKAKSSFLTNMSHELRTPLNAIISYSELLEEEAEDRELTEFSTDLQKITTAGRHLLSLLNNILDISKIEAGKMSVHLETVDVEALVREVFSTIQPLARTRHNKLDLVCGASLGTMFTDGTKVRQALFNLLSNACKFTERGRVWLEVTRETVQDKDWLSFIVNDSGLGMNGGQMEKLFQDFSQVHDPAKNFSEGTGLGLSLTRQLCQLVGGSVMVASDPGSGSTFTVRLPAAGPTSVPLAPPAPISALTAADLVKQIPMSRGDILIIEDDAAVQELMRHYLTKTGFTVRSAKTGDEGLRMAREARPAAITVDVMMPGMDGWAFLREIRNDPSLAGVPVIVASMVDDKGAAISLGVKDYLTKPIDYKQLIKILQKYKGGRVQRSILVVDDDQDARERMMRKLESEGFDTMSARNGKEALDVLALHEPMLIVLDLMMPEMNGFEFIAALQNEKSWRSIPVVVLTAKDLTPEERQRLSGYVEEVVQKKGQNLELFVDELSAIISEAATSRSSAA